MVVLNEPLNLLNMDTPSCYGWDSGWCHGLARDSLTVECCQASRHLGVLTFPLETPRLPLELPTPAPRDLWVVVLYSCSMSAGVLSLPPWIFPHPQVSVLLFAACSKDPGEFIQLPRWSKPLNPGAGANWGR